MVFLIQLIANNLHFLGESEEHQAMDRCLHGSVYLEVNGNVISDGDFDEWCVSASAIRFLRSLFSSHDGGKEEHMIPCCGHMMSEAEDGESVVIIGCNSGIDFDVIRDGDRIIVRMWNGTEIYLDYNEYKNAVLKYAKQIGDYYQNSPKRICYDEYDEKGFNAFAKEYRKLYEKALK